MGDVRIRKTTAFCAVVVLLLVLSSCTCSQYDESDFLGKTSSQIEEVFGRFHCVGKDADEDGLYRNTTCGYTLCEPKVGFFGTDPEVLFLVFFDENGIARSCYQGHRPGG